MALPLWFKKLLIRTRIAGLLPVAHRLTDGGPHYLRYLSDRVLAAPHESLLDPAFFPGPVDPTVIDLHTASPRFDLASVRVPTDMHEGECFAGSHALRNAIADYHVQRDGRILDPEREILVTHGASAAFAAALDAFLNRGDRVALFTPTSPLFHLGAKSRQACLLEIHSWNEEGRLRFPVAAFEKAVRRVKLLVLCNPNNPTGGCLAKEDLEYIAWFAASYNVLIYSDESFARFAHDQRLTSLATLPGAEACTLTVGSFAQAWGLTAAQVGWLAGPRTLVRACTLTANLAAPHVPMLCQQLATRALVGGEDAYHSVREGVRSRRNYTIDRLKAVGLEPEWPAGGFYAWVCVNGMGLDGRAFAERLLKEKQVLVGPGCVYGTGGLGHIRINFATEDGRLREGLSRLCAFVQELRTGAPVAAPVAEAEQPTEEANASEAVQPVYSRV